MNAAQLRLDYMQDYNTRTFETSDLYLTSFLVFKGFQPKKRKPNFNQKRVLFGFEVTQPLKEAIQEWTLDVREQSTKTISQYLQALDRVRDSLYEDL